MNVSVREFVPSPDTRPSALTVFELRAWARAQLWAAGEIDLPDAVDALQAHAARAGLVETLGADRVQEIMAIAFHEFRDD